jgi:hypothetical protein
MYIQEKMVHTVFIVGCVLENKIGMNVGCYKYIASHRRVNCHLGRIHRNGIDVTAQAQYEPYHHSGDVAQDHSTILTLSRPSATSGHTAWGGGKPWKSIVACMSALRVNVRDTAPPQLASLPRSFRVLRVPRVVPVFSRSLCQILTLRLDQV